jgi:uncharacterized membrane-anchored protein
MRPSVLALVLALPLASIVMAIVRAEARRAQAEEWTFVATGYDPRDLLHGRYVRFRMDVQEDRTQADLACSNGDPNCCLCLTKVTGSEVPRTRRTRCEDAARCDGRLQARSLDRIDRYYVPEERANELDARVRDAANEGRLRVVLSIDPTGRAEVIELRIAGERVR